MLKWYVDGSHNVHWDCKGHRGAVFTLGKGATSSYSRKVKKSNTRSSTETELYTADMFMPEMLSSLHFIQAQGYEAECVGLYQDNISTHVGTLKDGYIRRVPLPRVPRIQSTSPVACATIHRNPTHTGYSPIARIPTWSDMIESLSGLGRCIERYIPPFSPVRLM